MPLLSTVPLGAHTMPCAVSDLIPPIQPSSSTSSSWLNTTLLVPGTVAAGQLNRPFSKRLAHTRPKTISLSASGAGYKITRYVPSVGKPQTDPASVRKDRSLHLYFQYNATGNTAGNQNWGHATSSDLIHWKNASPFIAIASDPAEVYAIKAKDFPARGISPGAEE
jgi:hypothetical protein